MRDSFTKNFVPPGERVLFQTMVKYGAFILALAIGAYIYQITTHLLINIVGRYDLFCP